MAKRTLLSLTQNILSSMNSDQVGSIDDTEEARQVAEIIRETYEEMMSQRDWPHLKNIGKLDGFSNTSFPTKLVIPSNVDYVEWIKYDKKIAVTDSPKFEEITHKTPEEFLDIVQSRSTDTANVTSFTDPASGVEFNIITDTHPSYWTSFDNDNIIFDSYYSSLDSTLQQSKNSIYAVFESTWVQSDNFIPDLPAKMFSFLLAESKEVAMLNLRQIANQKEATRSRRQNNTMQHRSYQQNGIKGYKAYGRK